MLLIDLDDAQLQSRLGLTVEDVALLRSGPREPSRRLTAPRPCRNHASTAST